MGTVSYSCCMNMQMFLCKNIWQAVAAIEINLLVFLTSMAMLLGIFSSEEKSCNITHWICSLVAVVFNGHLVLKFCANL